MKGADEVVEGMSERTVAWQLLTDTVRALEELERYTQHGTELHWCGDRTSDRTLCGREYTSLATAVQCHLNRVCSNCERVRLAA